MTTNAIDKKKKVVASDSRWSFSREDMLFYVDDTGFDKIADRDSATIVCAGDGVLIEEWRNWFLSLDSTIEDMPRVERDSDEGVTSITITALLKPDCVVAFSNGLYKAFGEDAFFAGSGAEYAWDCYSQNRCGKQSVSSAGQVDPATGGETKFVDHGDNSHNLSDTKTTLAEAKRQMLNRGYVMDIQTGEIASINGGSSLPMNAANALASGEVVLSAPTGLPAKRWSESEKTALKETMQRILDAESKKA